jgi:ketosteroid isomerase-like protein
MVHRAPSDSSYAIGSANNRNHRETIMRRIIALVALAGICLTTAQARPQAKFNAPRDVASIKAIETVLATETDMDKLIGYYAPDAIVLDIYAPGILKGRDQIRAGFAPQLAAIRSMKSRIADINIASNGNFACAAMQLRFDTVMKDGTALKISLRQLDAFKKIGGKWQIIQQHISLPVDAKTGMAVMDGPLPIRGPVAWPKNPISGPATTPAQAKLDVRRWMDVGAVSTSLAQLMPYYGPGDDVIVYDSYFPGELRGRKEISDYYAQIMGSYNAIKVNMPEFVTDSDGVFAVQADTQDMKLAMKDGTTKYIALRQSDCMRRVGSKWYSFMEMISYPIDPKTNRAIMENPAAFSQSP